MGVEGVLLPASEFFEYLFFNDTELCCTFSKYSQFLLSGASFLDFCCELTYCLNAPSVMVTVVQTNRHLKNYVRQQMINSLIKLFSIPVIHCTPCCHRLPQHPNITTSGVVHTRTLFHNMTLTCATTFLTRMLYKDSY